MTQITTSNISKEVIGVQDHCKMIFNFISPFDEQDEEELEEEISPFFTFTPHDLWDDFGFSIILDDELSDPYYEHEPEEEEEW